METLGKQIAVVGAVVSLLLGWWTLATTWQQHLDTASKQCEQIVQLDHIIYAEHPEYTSWIIEPACP